MSDILSVVLSGFWHVIGTGYLILMVGISVALVIAACRGGAR